MEPQKPGTVHSAAAAAASPGSGPKVVKRQRVAKELAGQSS